MNKLLKFIFTFILIFFASFIIKSGYINAQENTQNSTSNNEAAQVGDNNNIDIYFFWREGCPHCAKEKPFLDKMEEKYPEINIHRLEVTTYPFDPQKNKENRELFLKIGQELGADVSGVPFTLIGREYIIGFYNEETTGKQIEEKIQCAIKDGCFDLAGEIMNNQDYIQEKNATGSEKTNEKIIVPILGELDLKNLSLPMLTITLGLLDGFNPCAMWVLLFLISLLIGIGDRKRMWILGGAFIAASAAVYFVFLSAWLNFFLLIGFEFWLKAAIALVALYAGYYNLKEYFTNKEAVCKVTHGEKRQEIFSKLREITKKEQLHLALIGIVLLAFAVNLVELFCSAGLPAIYTRVLTMSSLSAWQYYGYITIYVFFFMLDDMIVFVLAMKTLEVTGLTTKYSRISHLIGGVLMLLIGILLIFKPEWLMMGI